MFNIVTHAQAVILRSLGEALVVIQQQTGITPRHVRNLHNEAQKRGWDPGTPLMLQHVKNKVRSGRPIRITPSVEQAVVDAVLKDRYGREESIVQLGLQFNISPQSTLRILHNCKSHKT